MLKKVGSIVLVFCISACGAHTSIKTSKSPDFQSKFYQKILVDAQGLTVPNKVSLEWAFKNKFEKDGNIQLIPASDLFPPSKTFSDDEKRAVVLREKMDGILVVLFTGQDKVERVVPPGPVQTDVKKDEKGNTTVTTHQDPGYIDVDRVEYYELTLLDTQNFKPVWIGFANTRGDYGFTKSLTSKILSKMTKDGLIQKK